MSARFFVLPFASTSFGPITPGTDGRAAKVVVSNGRVSSELDLATGVTTAVSGAHRRARLDPSVGLAGLGERVRETTAGPATDLFDPAAPERVLAAIGGELIDAARTGPLALLSVGVPIQRWDVVATLLAPGAPVLHLPGAWRTALAAEGAYAIAATGALLHVFRADGDGLAAITFAVPSAQVASFDAQQPDARIVAGQALVLATSHLLVLDLAAVPFRAGAHHAIAVNYAPVVGEARGLRAPGVVAAIVGAKVLVDHPDVRRVTIERQPTDPPVKAGDRVMIDDVREPLPGILKVHAWHVAGGAAPSVRPPPPPIALEAPAVQALAPAPTMPRTRPRNAEVMQALAARWGFAVPHALAAFLAATDEDPVLCRWLARLGLETIEVRSLAADWNADPCVVALAGRGNGDELALYLYPPSLARGEEPLVVEFWHETNETTFVAIDFAAYLARWLDEQTHTQPEIAALVRARLGSLARARTDPAPSWLLPERVRPIPREEIARIEASGDWLAAERAWLPHYLSSGPGTRDAKDALARTYERLGWSAAREALRTTDG